MKPLTRLFEKRRDRSSARSWSACDKITALDLSWTPRRFPTHRRSRKPNSRTSPVPSHSCLAAFPDRRVSKIAGFLTSAFLVFSLLSAQTFNEEGWRLAVQDDPAWRWAFPDCLDPQPEFKTEWWYFTGHLTADSGGRYGYQFTLFRIGVRPPKTQPQPAADPPSSWRFESLWMGHCALTDEGGKRYHFDDRLVRGIDMLAGFRETGVSKEFYIGDWILKSSTVREQGSSEAACRFHLNFRLDDVQMELEIRPNGLVLQGDNGWSQKAAGEGRASYYLSAPQMPTRGTLRLSTGESLSVTGRSWFDREIGSNQLQGNQAGWDWFAIQLADGSSLMLYRMRLKDGGFDPHSHGAWMPAPNVQTNGAVAFRDDVVRLTGSDYSMEAVSFWTSPHTGTRYPVEWRISVPKLKLDLALKAALKDQEFRASQPASVSYWEGSHEVRGTIGDRPVEGRAYVELTGYDGEVPGL